ncbi:hypothetical protein FZC79_13530 [Rossellomorea vietnamensis]|uniref:Uncharacterized protein n=1 Tax=Rossellomorea vietnamensis TaxID=218284 RepID=A0A5D4KCU1_9BACI|nr:hypothetical protein [Rossellomorea vietnamensis]TYR74495.1 hypothetical protein FZC79_13530 [Rossellomorea vietnamensis]
MGILLFATGCTNAETSGDNSEEGGTQSAAEQNIEAFLENAFTGPTEAYEQAFLEEADNLERRDEKISEYYQNNFEPYMSESLLEGFINSNGATQFLRFAYPDYVLATEEITLEEDEDYYTFAADVSYTKKESDDSGTFTINGNMQTDEEGVITGIQYHKGQYEKLENALK